TSMSATRGLRRGRGHRSRVESQRERRSWPCEKCRSRSDWPGWRSWRCHHPTTTGRSLPFWPTASCWKRFPALPCEGWTASPAPSDPDDAVGDTGQPASARHDATELRERLDVALDVVVFVLDADRPLLLIARSHEDPPIHHPRPRGGKEIAVALEEVPVVAQRLPSIGHATLGS